ncbi:MAG: prepilin-type N-terminal cleavage/methylation domain-containing protein [Phycisphaerales bacterium]|nr:prepilin-type N-terminal cleavage/methylation domain-containing protein [Phycisphaerales bacterium]
MTSERAIMTRGFSLIELLMSIMILAIGLISVAALFPAGIVQQQRAKDDMEGPAVAQSAIGIIRSKISQEDFGDWSDFWTREQVDQLFQFGSLGNSPAYYVQEGDWCWMRPAVADATVLGNNEYDGTVDVFNWLGYWNGPDSTVTDTASDSNFFRYCQSRNLNPQLDGYLQPMGIPYALDLDDPEPPRAIFSAKDRRWPPEDGSGRTPQYFWDFMLSRQGGSVYVAVYVYRIVSPRGDIQNWRVRPVNGEPVIPYMQQLNAPWAAGDGVGANGALPGTDGAFDPTDPVQSWQYPGQWIVDNIGSLHHVERGRVRPDQVFDDGQGVRFFNKVPLERVSGMLTGQGNGYTMVPQSLSHALPASSISMVEGAPELWAGGFADSSVPVVDRIWFMPRTVEMTSPTGMLQQWELVPVFVQVERL